MAKIRVTFESGEPEQIIEFNPADAPFQHDGQPGSILNVLLGRHIHLHHAHATRSVLLKMVSGTPPAFIPGMFISISIPLPGEMRVRPYTITSSPEDGEPFEICFNRVPGGAGVADLFERGVGEVLKITGPFGAFTLDRPPNAETVFIAA